MKAIVAASCLLMSSAASAGTDFGVRPVGAELVPPKMLTSPARTGRTDLRSAAAIASSYGRVTSMLRTPEHNRRVGGVRNSYHLSGRAIDVARARGVSHATLERALRNSGLRIIESLDEGDHSHFAFGNGRAPALQPRLATAAAATASTNWGIVLAP